MTDDNTQLTNKLPALVVGILLLLGALLTSKHSRIIAVLLALTGCAFVGYSLTIKDWCVINDGGSAFSSAFSPSLNQCLREKGWLEW